MDLPTEIPSIFKVPIECIDFVIEFLDIAGSVQAAYLVFATI